jgi:hypothetical protein
MTTRFRRAARWLGALGVLATTGTLVSEAAASPETQKIRRQIRVFEAMVDRMLVDSPNWLVQGDEESRGSYVEGHGVTVTFDASLVGGSHGWGHDDEWWEWIWDEDDRVVVLKSDGTEDEEDWSARWRERIMAKQERLYTRGKTEIVDTILDFGDVLTFAKPEEWLEIDARLRRNAYFREKNIDRLTMKVKMADVRAFASEQLSEEEFVKRIQVEES